MTGNRIFPQKLDACIIGAGPAGLCAALRLLEMGHTVGMIEAQLFPREQIGESLSPGIRNIFSYLNAGHLLENSAYFHNPPAHIIWEDKAITYKHPGKQNGGIVVDRGLLDQELLLLAINRGLYLLQPAILTDFSFVKETWELTVTSDNSLQKIKAQVVLDARGRKGAPAKESIEIAPPSVAAWTHVDAGLMPAETLVEAVPEGWFWGSQVAAGRYRIMAFTDGKTIKNNKEQHLYDLAKNSLLFSAIAGQLKHTPTETCLVNTFVHRNPWNNRFIKIGDAAFTLDPLSSTGVEKAMRFSLQAAIAVNTYLKNQEESLPKDFYEEKLMESVSRHARWTTSYYSQAWPTKEGFLFWKNKANYTVTVSYQESGFLMRMQKESDQAMHPPPQKQAVPIPVDLVLNELWHKQIGISPLIEYKSTYATDNDLVEVILAVNHPNLERPIGYLEQKNLKTLLQEISGKTIAMALEHLCRIMPFEKAKKIVFFLWEHHLIIMD